MKRLYILSVDSLFYEDLDWIRKDCPYLNELLQRSALVKRVESVYPSMTYPAHATLLTGCYPDTHGISHNELIQADRLHPDWHWYRRDIKVPTFLDAAAQAGYRVATNNWPVTGSDPSIQWNIPEIWANDPDGDARPHFLSACSPNVVSLFDKYRHLLDWNRHPALDEFGLSCLTDIIEEHQPEVVLVHESYLDAIRHSSGGFTEETHASLRDCDRRFGQTVRQLKRLGIYEQTNFAVLGDHGHMPVDQVFNPNILLREKGLLQANEDGTVKSYRAYVHSAGLSAHVILADPGDQALRAQVYELLESFVADERLGCEQIIDKEVLKERWHLSGPFEWALEGRLGTAFGNTCVGDVIQAVDNRDYKLSVSSHGHLPVKGPQPTFFLAGPQIRAGAVLENCRMIDEAPTWAALLGTELPTAQGCVLRELLKE